MENEKRGKSMLLKKSEKTAFTLAEVLITLVVIGVVAALTIPSLMALIGTKVTENQQKVFRAKLIQGLNLAKTSGDLANNFTSTEDFLRNGLARHYKMAAICGTENLRDCIPYEEIKYMDGEIEKSIKVSSLKTAESIKVDKEGFEDTAAFITADGIPVILTYNKKCIVDTEQADREISSCIAGIYDLNGSKTPNKYSVVFEDDGETIKAYTYDIRTFNGASIGSNYPVINGVTIVVKAFWPKDIYESVGSPIITLFGNNYPNYYQAAKLYCQQNNAALSNREHLAKIARVLYDDETISYDGMHGSFPEQTYNNYPQNAWNRTLTTDLISEALGITINSSGQEFVLYSADQLNLSDSAMVRIFKGSSTEYTVRDGSVALDNIQAICVK